jgi:glycosyltransferase involved in cell wall biosynthesis
LFEPDNCSSLVDSLLRLHDDEGLRQRLVTTGREAAVERFDWRHIVDAHEETFARVLAKSQEVPACDSAVSVFR